MKTASFVLLFIPLVAISQDTVQITFDGPPLQPPGTGFSATNYYESGMFFRPRPGFRFSRCGASTDPRDPNDGTAFLRSALRDSLIFSFTNGSLFAMTSVDLAGYSSVVPDGNVYFIGYQTDGTTVQTNFLVNDIIFNTRVFGPEFTNLTRVEMPNPGWSMDNLVVLQEPVISPPPALTIEQTSYPSPGQLRKHQVRLSWPTNAGNHTLLFSTNLTSTNWLPLSPSPVVIGTNNFVTNDITGSQKFYRLSAR